MICFEKPYTVCLFGHRRIDDFILPEQNLRSTLSSILQAHSCVEFLIGRNGEFDTLAASAIKGLQKRYEGIGELVLVLPYKVADIPYYEAYYDAVQISEKAQQAHPKAAITLRNQEMVDRADLVVVFVEKQYGGAYAAMQYARKQGKAVLNLAKKSPKLLDTAGKL
jgi:hypothetical protein